MIKINSLSNKKIKEIEQLKKSRVRKKLGLTVVDGFREILLAYQAGWEIIELFYCPELIKKGDIKFFNLDDKKIIEVSSGVFNKICYKEKPDGFLAIIKSREFSLADIKLSRQPLIIILEKVEKPGNIGAILRTAYAAGVDALIINDGQTDIYNPNIIRASEGFIFLKPIINSSFTETVLWLENKEIKSVAAATSAAKNYTKINFKKGVAIVLGSEDSGLSKKWLESADELAKIKMEKGIDSLNVSVSAAVIIYEALRQRAENDKS